MKKQENPITPKISVVMPLYNCEKYIESAVDSVLNQTFTDFELLLINDASSDRTPEIIDMYANKDSRVRAIHNEKNLHIGGSLNKGISLSNANVIARMDGDDLCMPTRFEEQYKLLTSNTALGVVGCNMVVMDEDGVEFDKRAYQTDSKKLKSLMFRYSPFAHPTTMFKKEAFEYAGGYNPKMSPTEDLDLWFKIGKKYEFSNVPKYLFKYRVFSESSSNKKLRNLEIKVLSIRFNAVKNLGYQPSISDYIYNFFQLVTIYLMPIKLRYTSFNYLRNEGFKEKIKNLLILRNNYE